MKTNKIRIRTRSKQHLPCLSWRLRPDSTSAGDMKIMPAIHSRSQDARAGPDSFASIHFYSYCLRAYENKSRPYPPITRNYKITLAEVYTSFAHLLRRGRDCTAKRFRFGRQARA